MLDEAAAARRENSNANAELGRSKGPKHRGYFAGGVGSREGCRTDQQSFW